MFDQNEVRELEIIALRSLPAQFNRFYDGWLMRFNSGFTRRANSIYPIYAQPDDVLATILHCEAEYNGVHQNAIFKMTNAAKPAALDSMLEDRGYTVDARTFVQTATLSQITIENVPATITSRASDAWINTYLKWMQIDESRQKAVRHTLTTIPTSAYFCTLTNEKHQSVAVGYGIHCDDWYGLFGIVVAPEARQQGYGEQITHALLYAGREQGAQHAYLQVASDNERAIRLYEKMGFRTQYDYWYRVRE